MSQKIKVSVFGVTGYTGIEMLKLVLQHPHFEVVTLHSPSHVGEKVSDIYPHLKGICDLPLTDTPPSQIAKQSNLIFLALPHGVSQQIVDEIIDHNVKIVDLSGDFRLKDPEIYEQWYGQKQTSYHLDKSLYAIPESNAQDISNTNFVANPGCFAITTILSLLPFKGLIKTVQTVGITGSSGSGKNPKSTTHHPERNNNLSSYKVLTHQHTPEIAQALDLESEHLHFVPTSGSFSRGIHTTSFLTLKKEISPSEIKDLFQNYYQDKPFIRIKDQVKLKEVIGSNFCDLALHVQDQTIVLQGVTDNLIKGAAGTALQNANLMFGFDQAIGLTHLIPLLP